LTTFSIAFVPAKSCRSNWESSPQWLDTEPEVSAGRWFKRFSGMTVCGEGELLKTFLLPGQAASGEDLP
jgi:hypothetical protein